MIYLMSISTTLSLLFSALIMAKKKKRVEHYFLAGFFLMASLNVGYLFAHYQNEGVLYVTLLTELHYSITVLYGTIIFFYTKASTQSNFKFEKRHLIHFSLFTFYLFFFFLKGLISFEINAQWRIILYTLKPITNAAYLIITLNYLYKLRRSQPFLKENQVHRKWLLWLVIGGLVICGISVTGYILNKVLPAVAPMSGDYFLGAFLGVYFFILGFIALKNTGAFQNKWIMYSMDQKLSATSESEMFNRLLRYMEQEKPFLDAQLSLYKLSEFSAIPVSKLSRLINQYGHSSFYDFVNKYRVREVKERMVDRQYSRLSLLGMALDSGFNSKASFNRTFKKFTGLTPSAYRKQFQ